MPVAAEFEYFRGQVVWAELDPTQGKEYSGRRPALVISTDAHIELVQDLLIILPITTTNRGWPNHIEVKPADLLSKPSWVVTEQPRTISRNRIKKVGGVVDRVTIEEVDRWLTLFTKSLPERK